MHVYKPTQAERRPDCRAESEQEADHGGAPARGIEGREQRHQVREVVGVTRRRERPDIEEREVRRQLMDSPGMGDVCAVREPHVKRRPAKD